MTVTNGRPDGNGHPYVGIGLQPAPGGGFFVCSGAFISPTRFLTAAHCFDPSAPALVSPRVSRPSRSCRASCTTIRTGASDRARLQGFDSHDVAVIELAAPVLLPGYTALPAPGLVDTLPMKTEVDIVGYGVQGFVHGGGTPQQIFTAIRFFAPSKLVQSKNLASGEFIKLTANPSKGTGGVCFGDSGGPDVLSGTNIVLAVNSYVTNGNCSGVTYSQRVDLPGILAFINSI